VEEKLVRPVTVAEFQRMNLHIYGKANERYTDSDLILRFYEDISDTMETARKDELEKLPSQIARNFSFANAVANRFEIDMQEALWHKYPGVCPHCLREQNCMCSTEHPDIPDKEQMLRWRRRDRTLEPKTLAEHQAFHGKLYARQNRRILVIQTAGHLTEEAGEISKEYRHKNKPGMQDELADSFSWMFALANRCGFELAETVWNQYPYECEKCRETVCECHSSKPPTG